MSMLEELLAKLRAAGFGPSHVALVPVLPALEVAWSDGAVGKAEGELLKEQAWEGFRRSFRLDLLTATQREFLVERPSRDLVLAYQADLLERPLEDVVRWRDDGLRRLRPAGTPYVSLHAAPVDPADHAFFAGRLPQAEILVWPVGHHFPHVVEPERFAGLLRAVSSSTRSRGALRRTA